MRNKFIEVVEAPYLRQQLPEVQVGDTVNIAVSIKEGSKERIQKFEGFVIARSGTGLTKTITVRKVSSGVGVERVFPLHSPLLKEIKVLATQAIIRRAKLYYMRNRRGKQARMRYKLGPAS